LDLIEIGNLKKVYKFLVSLQMRVIGYRGEHPYDICKDPGCTKIPQYAYPLVALLHIKVS
jgi:hypothetical protein